MTSKTTLFMALGGLIFSLALGIGAANAQATRTWVSGVGDDANPCSRTAPCKTFPGAISKTAPAGEIDVLDPGGFGSVTITKSITIAAEGPGEGGVLVSGTNGIVVTCSPCNVILRGLQIDGIGTGINGVSFVPSGGATLEIQNSTIRNFNGSPNSAGVSFAPTAGTSQLIITDTTLTNNGNGTTGGGVMIAPTGAANVNAMLERVNAVNGVGGFRGDASSTTGAVNMTIADSVASNNTGAGIAAVTFGASGTATARITRTSVSYNAGKGLNATGGQTTMRIGESIVTGNGTGVAIASGATLTSLGDNQIEGNTAPGATVPVVAGN